MYLQERDGQSKLAHCTWQKVCHVKFTSDVTAQSKALANQNKLFLVNFPVIKHIESVIMKCLSQVAYKDALWSHGILIL